MKLNRTNRRTLNAVLIVILLLLVLQWFMSRRTSGYRGKEITIEPASDESLFDLPVDESCLPGPDEKSSAYAIPPGGVCGAQKLVRDHASYKII